MCAICSTLSISYYTTHGSSVRAAIVDAIWTAKRTTQCTTQFPTFGSAKHTTIHSTIGTTIKYTYCTAKCGAISTTEFTSD